MTALSPAQRLEFSSIEKRAPLPAPDGARVILWPVFALEVWDIGRAMARTVLPPPQHQPLIPDVPNWTWHEYGMRVGFWRLKRMFQALGVSPTVTLNARVCLEYPEVAAACKEMGWEFNAHAYEQVPMHKLDDQRASIFKTMEVIEKFFFVDATANASPQPIGNINAHTSWRSIQRDALAIRPYRAR